MDLVNKQVIHERFGKGNVVLNSDSLIEIHFPSGNRKFVFPDAFKTHLTLIDQRAANSVNQMIEKSEKENINEELELEKVKALQHKEQLRLLDRERFMKNHKINPSSQVVFRCEAQDKNNVFTQWRVFTGVVKNGVKEGQTKQPTRMYQNSACLLTAIDPDMPEKDRRILGVYMVNDAFIGKLCEDGFIPAHPEYRLRLSEQESEKMLFWNYYVNENYPHNMTWNSGEYRYFDNVWMAQILRDIVLLKKDPQEREFVKHFFEYFCQMNRIGEEEIPKANGALMRI